MRILTEKEIKEFEGLVAKARVSIEAIQNYILYATSTPDENCIPDEETFRKGLTTLEQNALESLNNFAEVANQGVKGTYIKIFSKGE